jgi:GTPase KRas protein
VGNKKDLYNNREISTEEGKYLAQRLGVEFIETSAKSNSNVEAAFKSVVRQIKANKGGMDRSGIGGGGGGVGTGGGSGKKKKEKKCVIL